MQFDVITLFPSMFESPFAESMIKRAIGKGLIKLNLHDLRQWAVDEYGAVDDRPFGGSVGMLLRPEPVYEALQAIHGEVDLSPQKKRVVNSKKRIVLMTAGGTVFDQAKAEELSNLEQITIISGHYEGYDQRIHDYMVDEELSIGKYVLTGGELPAMVVIDAVSRLLPGVLGKDASSKTESYSEVEIEGQKKRLIEEPQYTRPRDFKGLVVPEVLYSGDPKKIEAWKVINRKS